MSDVESQAAPSDLVWEPFDGRSPSTGEACDLHGHFWARLQPGTLSDGTALWSWMIIGYENQVVAAGQTGDPSAAKALVQRWDAWVRSSEAVLDESQNPASIADDCATFASAWPSWGSATTG